MYMLQLGEVIRRHGMSFNCYADDSQLYIPIKPNDPHMLSALHECLNDMALHFLQLNYNNSEILVSGPQHITKQILPSTDDWSQHIKPVARSLKAHSHPTVKPDTGAFVPEVVSSVSLSVARELSNPERSGRNGAIQPETEAAVESQKSTHSRK